MKTIITEPFKNISFQAKVSDGCLWVSVPTIIQNNSYTSFGLDYNNGQLILRNI